MTNPEPTIRIVVDVTNPGQFFACCGLLELADRLWPGAEGWFSEQEFCLSGTGTLPELLAKLSSITVGNTMSAGDRARLEELSAMKGSERSKHPELEAEKKALEKRRREDPIVLTWKSGVQEIQLRLDWFLDDSAGGSRFKTWAGQQSVLDIATSMKQAHDGIDWDENRAAECLRIATYNCGLPFNFDSDLGGQGAALDLGFSFDPLAGSAATRIQTGARPTLEWLAFVGLQRCRPIEVRGENRFIYQAWGQSLPVGLSGCAACGHISIPHSRQLEFRLLYRTNYLKSFLPAIPLKGISHG